MVKCPRCGNLVDQLQSVPRSTLTNEPRVEQASDEMRACRWCVHEIIEE
jgi:hypothetical protein